MKIIIKRGTNACSFALSNGRAVVLQPEPVMNEVGDEDFGRLLKEYGAFIRPRVHNDKNPDGVFIISDKALKTADQAREAGKLKDGCAPATEGELKEVAKKAGGKKKAAPIKVKTEAPADNGGDAKKEG